MDRRAGDLDRWQPDDSGTARLMSDSAALHRETSRDLPLGRSAARYRGVGHRRNCTFPCDHREHSQSAAPSGSPGTQDSHRARARAPVLRFEPYRLIRTRAPHFDLGKRSGGKPRDQSPMAWLLAVETDGSVAGSPEMNANPCDKYLADE